MPVRFRYAARIGDGDEGLASARKSDRLQVNHNGKGDIQPRSLRDEALDALHDASLKSSSLE